MALVLQKVRDGSVSVRVKYGQHEFLLHVRRLAYFPTFFPQLIEFFSAFAPLPSLSPWLESESVPIKWNLPVGVLYDLLWLPSHPHGSESLVWDVSLHMLSPEEPFPSHIIPFSKTYSTCLDQVLVNTLKQACYVVCGNSRSVMSLSEEDTLALWRAILLCDFTIYDSIMAKAIPARSTAKTRIPVKIYVAGSAQLIQAPILAQDSAGQWTTLRDVCEMYLPELTGWTAFCHGIDIAPVMLLPLLEVWTNLRHLDYFLYVVIAV